MAGLGSHPADFLQRFEGRLQTPAGERPVVVVLDLAGLRLEGPPPGSDLLGSFPFTQITQWETGMSETFSFTVRTDSGGEQTINVRSSPPNVQGLQAGVEAKVGRIMDFKSAGADLSTLRSPEQPAAPILPMEDPALRGGMGMIPHGGGMMGMMPAVSGMGMPGMMPNGVGAAGGMGGLMPGGGMGMPGMPGMMGFGGAGMAPAQPAWQTQVTQPAAAAPAPAPAPVPAPAPAPPATDPPPAAAKRPLTPPRRAAPTPPPPESSAGRRGADSDRKGNRSGGSGAGPAEGRKAQGAGTGGKGKLKAAVEGTMAVRRFKKGPRGKNTKQKEPQGPEELQRALQETREYAQRMKEALAGRDRELVELRQNRNLELGSKDRMLDSLHSQEGELEALKRGVLSLSTAGRSPPTSGPMQGYTKGKRFPWESSMAPSGTLEVPAAASKAHGRFSPRQGADLGPRDALLAENNALKAQLGRLMADGSQDYQMEAAELRAANSELRQHSHDLERQLKEIQSHSLVDKLKTALFTTEQEVVQLQERIGQLEDEAGKHQATAATQERALQEYEAAMAQSVASPFGMGAGLLSPGGLEAAGTGQAGDPLGQLRELMGEAYLLKMALRKEHPGAEHSTILRALDKWIMASHSLKKACVEKPGEGFGRGGGGGWGGLSAPGV